MEPRATMPSFSSRQLGISPRLVRPNPSLSTPQATGWLYGSRARYGTSELVMNEIGALTAYIEPLRLFVQHSIGSIRHFRIVEVQSWVPAVYFTTRPVRDENQSWDVCLTTTSSHPTLAGFCPVLMVWPILRNFFIFQLTGS